MRRILRIQLLALLCNVLAHVAADTVTFSDDLHLAPSTGESDLERLGGSRALVAEHDEKMQERRRDSDVQIRRLEARLRALEDVEVKVNSLEATVASLQEQLQAQQRTDSSLRTSVQSLQMRDFVNPIDSGEMAFTFNCVMVMLMMTIPGLALFYGGLVRMQNVLATVMQSFSICCLITVLWLAVGYSLSFSEGSAVFGGASRFWLQNISLREGHPIKPSIPEPLFILFNLMFAIITPALISGAFADRMKFGPMLVFIALWHILVYCPLAHASWHPEGFLHDHGVLDFAGGNVVHVAAGISGLVASIMVGKRIGFGMESFHAHNMLLSVLGASLLWVGWLGFNGGSYPSGKIHLGGIAMLNTQISGATASLSWMVTEWIIRKRPSVLGIISGSLAGLVTITPGAGYVDNTGAFIFGLLAGPVCYFAAQLKHRFGFDDALDAFGIHGPGGALGGVLTGLFATSEGTDDSDGPNGAFYGDGRQLGLQIYGVVVSAVWAAVVTFILLKVIDVIMGLRVHEEEEKAGLDMVCHGETIMPQFPDFGAASASGEYYPNELASHHDHRSIPDVDGSRRQTREHQRDGDNCEARGNNGDAMDPPIAM